MQNKLRDNAARHRFELDYEDKTVFADYRKEGNLLSILYVEAPPELRGTGAASKLMEAIVQTARNDNLKIKPVCGYAVTWLQRHKEANDLLV